MNLQEIHFSKFQKADVIAKTDTAKTRKEQDEDTRFVSRVWSVHIEVYSKDELGTTVCGKISYILGP